MTSKKIETTIESSSNGTLPIPTYSDEALSNTAHSIYNFSIDDLSIWTIITGIITILGAISVILTIISYKKRNALLNINLTQAELDLQKKQKEAQAEKSAKIRVLYEKSGNGYKLKIRNNGKADADNVLIKVSENSSTFNSEIEYFNTNIFKISAMDSYEIRASPTYDTPIYDKVTILWDDEAQKRNQISFDIKVH